MHVNSVNNTVSKLDRHLFVCVLGLEFGVVGFCTSVLVFCSVVVVSGLVCMGNGATLTIGR